jgi:hypothetical protein
MMGLHRILLFSALLAYAHGPALAQDNAKKGTAASEYKVGERLTQDKSTSASKAFKEVTWEALVPKHWDPAKMFKDLNLDKLDDSDPRAMEALERMRQAWNDAPVEPSLNGARIRIPGFVVPLDAQRGQLKEFLLVPYFGACIHTPPPPANQIIHVVSAKPLKNVQIMDAVWVNGTLGTGGRIDTEFGASGYQMKAEAVTPYKEK